MTFEVVEGAFKRGQHKLFDSRGYLYCVKRQRQVQPLSGFSDSAS